MAKTLENIKKIGFNHLGFNDMYDYIEEHEPSYLDDWAYIAYELKYPCNRVPQVDENGNPIMKNMKDKETNTYKTIQAVKMVPDTSKEPELKLNMLKAKRAFCERYIPELLPKKDEKKKSKAQELLKRVDKSKLKVE